MSEHLTPAELSVLLEAARAATPGPYEARLGSGNNVCTALASSAPGSFDEFVCDVLPNYACRPGLSPRWEANRNFIQIANPATIERLVLMVRESQRLLTECCYTIQALAEQQAMPDDAHERTLRSVGLFLEPLLPLVETEEERDG